MNKKIREAVRVVGHLLETRGTTGVYARTKSGKPTMWDEKNACRFCLQGASNLVITQMLGHVGLELDHAINKIIGQPDFYSLVSAWDETDKAGRKAIVEKLKNA